MSRVAETRLYDILKVKPNVTDHDLKKAFRKLSKDCKLNGATEQLKDIEFAYSVLSNSEKRKAYDNLGEAAVMEDDDPHDPHSIFSNIFGADSIFGFGGGGGGRGGRSRHGPRRGEDVHHMLRVSLEDMYNGKQKQLQLTKKVICSRCKGVGGKADSVKTCTRCRGRGICVMVRQLGPGMVQQMQTACTDCHGQGEIIDDKFRCKTCNGQKVVQEKKVLEVNIERGMKSGQRIPLRKEGDQLPGTTPGDIIIVLQEKEHELFHRDEADLIIDHKIGLTEALCGFKMTVQHLDGRVLLLNYKPGEIIQPDCIRGVIEEGMPVYRRPKDKGHLYVKFTVIFPESHWIDADQIKTLERFLSPRPEYEIPEVHEEVDLVNIEETRGHPSSSARSQEAYHSDLDHEGHGPRTAGCAQQ
ncbi:dnaJ homolog subfamily A member 2-like [Corticium candelabrum]|uniref:dnaJ homolog subfamily A member 2-like n=1 Tax=Corticium candelabrum TaxID=121492 RepID=UPI002E26811C|nr:dnaJ homolog subfamily A member 2-like [Corticium candelabrum]